MTNIVVLGGSGYSGAAIAKEAALRGHTVTSISRNVPTEKIDGVEYVQGSVVDDDVLKSVISGQDVVIEALSPRREMLDKVEPVVDRLIELAPQLGFRLGVVGGASSLLVAEGGPRLFDIHEAPAEVLPEIRVGLNLLETLQNTSEDVNWFYVSPPLEYGSWISVPATGSYRLSNDVLLKNADGVSTISADDLALAIVDEIETPKHHRQRFHAAL